jgi:uncharacterized protein (DUF697 family)
MSYADTVSRILAGDFEASTPEERREAITEVIQVCSVAAGAVAIQPIPLLDVVLITPIQVAMVRAIGRIYGHRLDEKAVIEMISTFGASIVAQNLTMAAAKLIPFAGWVASIAMAYGLTWAIGDVAAWYFENGRGVAPEDLRTRFRKVYEQKKGEKMAEHKGNRSLKQRLDELTEAFKAGHIDEPTYEAMKQKILSDF